MPPALDDECECLNGRLHVRSGNVAVSDHAGGSAEIAGENAFFLKAVTYLGGCFACSLDVEYDNVSDDLAEVERDAGDICDPASERSSVLVVLGQAFRRFFKSDQASGS